MDLEALKSQCLGMSDEIVNQEKREKEREQKESDQAQARALLRPVVQDLIQYGRELKAGDVKKSLAFFDEKFLTLCDLLTEAGFTVERSRIMRFDSGALKIYSALTILESFVLVTMEDGCWADKMTKARRSDELNRKIRARRPDPPPPVKKQAPVVVDPPPPVKKVTTRAEEPKETIGDLIPNAAAIKKAVEAPPVVDEPLLPPFGLKPLDVTRIALEGGTEMAGIVYTADPLKIFPLGKVGLATFKDVLVKGVYPVEGVITRKEHTRICKITIGSDFTKAKALAEAIAAKMKNDASGK